MQRTAGDKILVIEAQAETRQNMCGFLTQLGYRAEAAGCGDEALALLGDGEYDAVLLDATAEEPGGISLPEILARHPDVSVVVMSATPSVRAVIASLRSGAFDYIIKPYEIQDLASILPRATERSQENRRRRALYAGSLPGTGDAGFGGSPMVGPAESGRGTPARGRVCRNVRKGD